MKEDQVHSVCQSGNRRHGGEYGHRLLTDVAVFVVVGVFVACRRQPPGVGVPADGAGEDVGAVGHAGGVLPVRLAPNVAAARPGGGGHAPGRRAVEQLPRQLRPVGHLNGRAPSRNTPARRDDLPALTGVPMKQYVSWYRLKGSAAVCSSFSLLSPLSGLPRWPLYPQRSPKAS